MVLTHEFEYNSHIQHTLDLKVGVRQPDQTSLTWRMRILIFVRRHKHRHFPGENSSFYFLLPLSAF